MAIYIVEQFREMANLNQLTTVGDTVLIIGLEVYTNGKTLGSENAKCYISGGGEFNILQDSFVIVSYDRS